MSPARLIVYACPLGPLAAQIDHFFSMSRERFGPNSAHAYPPHITLTGFFHDEAAAIPLYREALAAAIGSTPRPSEEAITISELALKAEFHGLLISSPWLEALTAAFAARASSPTRQEELRLKSWLHLSLAYGFGPEHGPGLGELARELVDPNTPASWELRFYEQRRDGGWVIHGAWPL
jgi:ubiquitin-associated SH3 domain-containing protein